MEEASRAEGEKLRDDGLESRVQVEDAGDEASNQDGRQESEKKGRKEGDGVGVVGTHKRRGKWRRTR